MTKNEPIDAKSPEESLLDRLFSTKALFWFGFTMLFVSIVLLFVSVNIQNRNDPVHGVGTQPYKIGDFINMGNVDMSVEKVSFSAGQRSFAAPAGKEYAIVDFRVKNRSEKPIQVLPTTDTYMKDDKGNTSYLTPGIIEAPFRAGELLPGEEIRGQLSYLISKDVSYKLFVDAIWSGGVIPITIK